MLNLIPIISRRQVMKLNFVSTVTLVISSRWNKNYQKLKQEQKFMKMKTRLVKAEN